MSDPGSRVLCGSKVDGLDACYHRGCDGASCAEVPNDSECTPWVEQNTQGCPDLLTCDLDAGAVLLGAPTGCTISPEAGYCLFGGIFCVPAGRQPVDNDCVVCDPSTNPTDWTIVPELEGVERMIGPTCFVCRNGNLQTCGL